ncbi:MAG: hypothetical protein L6265_02785 [Thermoplasmatales archaeon]|nr:hypothetical protein [Candidatus Methanoperedenaceae archaeon]MCG2825502.1 hypothetical protein [Thermoplasmatales archaeon]
MDELMRAYYEATFEKEFLKKRGTAFQDFFSEIMEKCHPSDFQRVKPWGCAGDQKNDGYLRSQRTLFQSYAPNEMSASKAISKIDEDFRGALPYWREHFNCWVFVHNSREGLSPQILKKLCELGKEFPDITIVWFGFEELRSKVFSLSETDIFSVLGHVPSSRGLAHIGFAELKIVIDHIASQPPVEEGDYAPVSKEKLERNALSPHVQIILKAGMRKANLVQSFFNKWYDPTLGDKVATAFNNKYKKLKTTHHVPDIIFYNLQEFAGGPQRNPPAQELAISAVLAYLFERCDIFENPPEVKIP